MAPVHFLHHSRLISAPSSEVGDCIHCAFHFATGNVAFTFSSSSAFQYSGHTGPWSMIAGNSTTSHWSAFTPPWFLSNIPVRSLVLHLVITKTIFPPGCRRCLGPEVYQSWALSSAVSESASCSEWGSSMIRRSAPRPVMAPPTPAAKYSPPCAVSHLPAAFESSCNLVSKIL